jgi:hypothetical protein
MIVPAFDRWRARLIAHTDSESMGTMGSIRFAPVAPTVALVCPFERYDGEMCDQLITYYLQTNEHALGACHRHLAHALDILVTAEGMQLSDPSDDDLLAPSEAAMPKRAPLSDEDLQLAERLVASGLCSSADFGTTAIHEGFGLVVPAEIVLTGAGVDDERCADLIHIADDFGIAIAPQADGTVRLTTPTPDLSEEWICHNRALREMMRDALDGSLDPSGYHYRSIADALPEPTEFEPRVYTTRTTGLCEVRVQMLATTLEGPLQHAARDVDRRTTTLHLDRIPRPGDYLELSFARYRVVAVHPFDGSGPTTVAAVLDRIHRPSLN